MLLKVRKAILIAIWNLAIPQQNNRDNFKKMIFP